MTINRADIVKTQMLKQVFPMRQIANLRFYQFSRTGRARTKWLGQKGHHAIGNIL